MANNFDCELVYFKLGAWSDRPSNEYVDSTRLRAHILDATKNSFRLWLVSTFVQILSNLFYTVFKSLKLAAFGEDKRSWILARFLNNNKPGYTLIIAHNPGTFFPAYHFGKKHNIPFAIDVEDFHPGETTDPKIRHKLEHLMGAILPHASYTTFASPFILQYSQQLMGINSRPQFVINNSFPGDEFSYIPYSSSTELKTGPIRLIWFSQNISFGRGLELIIEALRGLPERFELHVVGYLYESFNEKWIAPNKKFIEVHIPMKQKELHKMLSNYDIGLALEPGKDLNNEIAVSNKIFAYAQAGLYVLATKTKAQEHFIKENQWGGVVCGQTVLEMQNALREIAEGIDKIRAGRKVRFEEARSLAWEHESVQLTEIWREISNS